MKVKKETDTSSYESVLKEAANKKKSFKGFSKTFPAYITLVLMLSISVIIFTSVRKSTNMNKNVQFDKAISSVLTRFNNEYSNMEQVVISVGGLYNMIDVVRDYFEIFSSVPVITFPSILSINYLPKVENSYLFTYIDITRDERYYEYTLSPKGERPIYFPVKHIVPYERNLHRQGLDLYTLPEIKKVIDRAPRLTEPVSSIIFNVRPDTLGFYIFKPVYGYQTPTETVEDRIENFIGLVGIEINANLYFSNALKGNKTETEVFASDKTIIFKIIDKDANRVVYQSENSSLLTKDYTDFLFKKEKLKLADRNLEISFYTVPNFGGKLQNSFAYIILVISVILSISFFGFVFSIITARARALDLAERITRSQRRIVDTSEDIIGVIDYNGIWKTINPASQKIFGRIPGAMIGTSFINLLVNDYEKNRLQNIFVASELINHQVDKVDLEHYHSSGEIRWINWNLTFSNEDQLVYAIGRDVTFEKETERTNAIKVKQIKLAEQLTRESSESKNYFLVKLSHQLRNSLTGITGFLQMVQEGAYDSKEEMLAFVNDSYDNAEKLFTYVTDIEDNALGNIKEKTMHIEVINLLELFTNIKNQYSESGKPFVINYSEDNVVRLTADKKRFTETIEQLLSILLVNQKYGEVNITGIINSYEGVAEIQMLGSQNSILHNMINLYKNPRNGSIIEALVDDQDDIISSLAICASNIRRMNGYLIAESFGIDEENLIQITIPISHEI